MNKKLLLIPVAIGIVILIFLSILKKDPVHGNLAEMEVPSEAAAAAESFDALTVILDNSGSMQGYVNFGAGAGFPDAKQTMITNVADFMTNVDTRCKLTSTALCGKNSYTSDKLIAGMRDCSVFSGAVTELDGLVKSAIELASDTGVAVIVSDMVLSYGKAAIVKSRNNSYNLQELPALSSLVGNQFKHVKDNVGVLILKYNSDFNGHFYYNYTENIEPCDFKKTLMKDRPYYFFVVGKDAYIKQLCAANCFPKPDAVYSTIEIDDKDMKTQSFTVKQTSSPEVWTIGDINNPEADKKTICLWTKDNFGDTRSTFRFSFDKIELPLYAAGTLEAEYDTDVVSAVNFDAAALDYFSVTLQPFDRLPKEDSDVKIKIELVKNIDATSCSVEKDTDVDATALEGKTWGFGSIIAKIYEAYGIENGDDETVAELKFAISKK